MSRSAVSIVYLSGMSQTPVPPPPPGLGTDPHPGRTILKSSRALLRQDRSLSLLPLIGGFCSIFAVAPLVVAQLVFTEQTAIQYVLYALTVFIGTTVATFFSVALAAGAAARMDGGDPTIGSCINVAMGNLWSIIRWALFATIIGLVLRAIEARLKGVGGTLIRVIGDASFAVASYFVIPMLAHEKIGPIAALKASTTTIRAQWSKTIRFTLRMGLWAFLVFLGSFAVLGGAFAGGMALAASSDAPTTNIVLGAIIVVAGLVFFVWAMLYVGAVGAYGRTALYRYATGRPVPGFSMEALQGAAKVKETGHLPA